MTNNPMRATKLTGIIASLLNIDPDKDTWHKSNLDAVEKEIISQLNEVQEEVEKLEFSKEYWKQGFTAGALDERQRIINIIQMPIERKDCIAEGHDDRWCSNCDSMRDGLDLAYSRVEALQPSVENGSETV